tara:strand:+ start:37755 stop:38537 length:783 start_codon:yes stop_codon:yes gene_type:complete
MHHTYGYFWDFWDLAHKVNFDGFNRLITIPIDITEIDVRIDLYSAWKEWMLIASAINMKWVAAFRSTGGDPLPGGEFLGRTFFLINGWRIVLDHGINFTGNLFTESGDPPFITVGDVPFATSTVSTLVVDNLVEATITAAEISQAVWDVSVNSIIAGSIGDVVLNLQDAIISGTSMVDNAGTNVSTNSSLQTLLIKPDGYYDDSSIIVIDSVGNNVATRQIDQYFSTGQIDLIDPLPFVPSDGASIIILNKHDVNRGGVS